MKFSRIPLSIVISVLGVLSIPAIAFASLHAFYPSNPDLVYTMHGDLNVEWHKFSETDEYVEYLAKEKKFDEDTMVANILVLRDYKRAQTNIFDHSKVVYSSALIHESISCWGSAVSIEDVALFSKNRAKGDIVKDYYDLDGEIDQVKAGSIDDMKVKTFCQFST